MKKYNDLDGSYSLEFWHKPELNPGSDSPFAFVMKSKSGEEMGIWLNRKDIERYIRAMQRALGGEADLNSEVH